MFTRLFMLVLGCFFMTVGHLAADDEPKLDLRPLLEEVRKVVQKHYPKAKVTLEDGNIHFEFNTRKYMIHEPLKTGEWQDAHEEIGPQRSGIYGDIEIRQRQYGGAALAPQAFDKRYFTVLLLAPYSQKLDHHLYVHLKYPNDAPKEFLKEFVDLINGFEKHVSAKGK